ncbi:hypothetical protein FB45DRAFT_997789 [Roridomyces roridus]|uniref:Uncharacterized protein n=1 Tax=Roridomyces roridus TaxID=1738132 RepID=A0AAD7G1V7_9AGAR|nr:hypothetical protein FB45DRAFT_997789 [Roridomyces roridus]
MKDATYFSGLSSSCALGSRRGSLVFKSRVQSLVILLRANSEYFLTCKTHRRNAEFYRHLLRTTPRTKHLHKRRHGSVSSVQRKTVTHHCSTSCPAPTLAEAKESCTSLHEHPTAEAIDRVPQMRQPPMAYSSSARQRWPAEALKVPWHGNVAVGREARRTVLLRGPKLQTTKGGSAEGTIGGETVSGSSSIQVLDIKTTSSGWIVATESIAASKVVMESLPSAGERWPSGTLACTFTRARSVRARCGLVTTWGRGSTFVPECRQTVSANVSGLNPGRDAAFCMLFSRKTRRAWIEAGSLAALQEDEVFDYSHTTRYGAAKGNERLGNDVGVKAALHEIPVADLVCRERRAMPGASCIHLGGMAKDGLCSYLRRTCHIIQPAKLEATWRLDNSVVFDGQKNWREIAGRHLRVRGALVEGLTLCEPG